MNPSISQRMRAAGARTEPSFQLHARGDARSGYPHRTVLLCQHHIGNKGGGVDQNNDQLVGIPLMWYGVQESEGQWKPLGVVSARVALWIN